MVRGSRILFPTSEKRVQSIDLRNQRFRQKFKVQWLKVRNPEKSVTQRHRSGDLRLNEETSQTFQTF
jgi:hypothetical protein